VDRVAVVPNGIKEGFINEDGNVGDRNEAFLGEVTSAGQVLDSKDSILGKVDLGTAEVSNVDGTHLFTIARGGDLTDGLDGYRGKFEDFTYHKLKVAVAYIFFIDGALVNPHLPSMIVSESTTHLSLSGIVIRVGENADVGVVAPFNVSDGNKAHVQRAHDEIHEKMQNKAFIVAEVDHNVVGYLLWESSALGYKNTWYLEQIVVKSEFRRKGVALALINHFIGIAKGNSNVKKILSMIQPDNVPSINLHTKSGFKISGNLYFQENDLRVLFMKFLQ